MDAAHVLDAVDDLQVPVRVEKAGDGYRWIPTIWNASL